MADWPQISSWYTGALERLVGVVRELSQARDVDTVTAIVREAARELTGADGATFVLRDGTQCYYADESAIEPLWKGKRFPMSACVSGWVMLNAETVVIPDIYDDARVPTEAYRPTFVKSLAMVPIRRNAPVGAIGNYWATNYAPSPQELALLEALADTTSVALENVALLTQLQAQVRELEAQRERISSQHSSLEVFTRALAHDLREPVRTLVSYSGMLEEDSGGVYLGYVRKAAGRMDRLIDAVSQYTRLDDPAEAEAALCSMNEVVTRVVARLSELASERRSVVQWEALPELKADANQLTQLMHNLIGNAIYHNAQGVTVTVGCRRVGEALEFRVSDDGVGVSAAQAEQIFLPFQRLTHAGDCAGLGLSICRRIVNQYGGEIRCETAPERGATFIFTLPGAEWADFDRDSTN